MTIDWRKEICRFLHLSNDLTDNEILDALDAVSIELAELRQRSSEQSAQPKPPTYQLINRIKCQQAGVDELYLDAPWIVKSGPYEAHLRGSNKIQNFELHLEQNKELTFLVFRQFVCCGQKPPPGADLKVDDFLVEEYVSNISREFRQALIELCDSALGDITHPDFEDDEVDHIQHPYLWWYHGRSIIRKKETLISQTSRVHLGVFQNYLASTLGHEWETVDSLLSAKHITAAYTHYLFVPNEICISKAQGSSPALLEAFKTTDWLDVPDKHITGTKWTFDGNFELTRLNFYLRGIPSLTEKFSIRELSIYPARFADPDHVTAIQQRGEMFWKCRQRNYVCYKATELDGAHNMSDPRFMVDIATFKQMHPSNKRPYRDDLGPAVMAQEKPSLSDEFFMCLPTTISGFHMHKKEWVTLQVGFVEDVIWNEEAFKSLVIDESTKELIQAVVTNQLHAEDQADMIHGKGNGLFILLHGGPGTGKTLTAESVAEIARKPLYKVTCGDIGTKAEEVEKYLEVVLLLGKTWGAVVLLDEADVFLEQRSFSNLERNALVSVFLRVLEYYDGILILTSNRVGTFDEAFRSRIQLTLRYENLNQTQRYKIWDNFFQRLETLEAARKEEAAAAATASSLSSPMTKKRKISGFGFDFQDIRKHIDELAERNLNGREIRNAISTARQLAMYKKEAMSYKHLERVIMETVKFEAYIKDLNNGFSYDELQRDKGER